MLPIITLYSVLIYWITSASAISICNSTQDKQASIDSPLFPVSPLLSHWTTSTSIPGALPLSDATFRPHNIISALSHEYVSAPDGRFSMRANYPKGSYTFSHAPQGGFSFYAPGPANVDLTKAKEATFGCTVYFRKGFDFVKGGKLPGICTKCFNPPSKNLKFLTYDFVDGGNSDQQALSCSGGRRDNGCFSARFMWRTNGAGELYTYLPPDFSQNQAVCHIPPYSTCNDVYGASVGRGSFSWKTGGRSIISQRVRLNDVGKTNGELEMFINGKSVVNVGGLVLRDNTAGRIRGIQFQTFFGGMKSHLDRYGH